MRFSKTMDLYRSSRSLLGWREVDWIASRTYLVYMIAFMPLAFLLSYLEGRLIGWAGISTWLLVNAVMVFLMFAALLAIGIAGYDFVLGWRLRRELHLRGMVIVDAEWRPTITRQSEERIRRIRRDDVDG
jgi:uncharacterized membrane protein YhdT